MLQTVLLWSLVCAYSPWGAYTVLPKYLAACSLMYTFQPCIRC